MTQEKLFSALCHAQKTPCWANKATIRAGNEEGKHDNNDAKSKHNVGSGGEKEG